jgi:eukaryotic-like serine/threonine-protein kinase
LTLRPAFAATIRAALIEQVIHDPPPAPRKVDPRIPRDLETIVLKALAKEPAERYATAEAMAADLENFLADRPIVARRSRLPERAWRWCRRNPAAAGLLAASGVAALALVGFAVGLVDNARVKTSERVAVGALEKAHAAAESERRLDYFHRIVLAERESTANNVRRTGQLLDECPTDLRGWEWYYLSRQRHTELRTLHVSAAQLFEIAFSPDGKRFASSDIEDESGNGLRVWDTESGEPVYTLRGHSGQPGDVCFSPDGTLLASSSGTFRKPGEVKLWDAATGKPLKSFPGATGAASRVAFSRDGSRLAAVSAMWNQAGLLTVWDIKTGERLLSQKEAERGMGLIDVAFSPDGKYVATASGILDSTSTENSPGEVKIRDSSTGDLIRTLS